MPAACCGPEVSCSRKNAALVALISRGLRWHALQVSAKICAADFPRSRFACARADETVAQTAAATRTHGINRAILRTRISATADPRRSFACHFWPKEDDARLGRPPPACLLRCTCVAAFSRVCSNSCHQQHERATRATVRSDAAKCQLPRGRG